ncbi:Signal transduction histidine-protein kinase AtoS (plasmid) [Sulfitobacter sp. DSM 110093]|uniref:sensor histidine kinase n=1 Tax=Sulfitobacter sp. DSM 110093 TaxID=2883127 RepID=UPI001FABD326|nr:cache domain-containing protein [Sulfitobacter sp. DSM 110093]UOA34147.1 Signal transduction histidine-protein kinase AtoS [Sulfitobacter sp. DSM 110093]
MTSVRLRLLILALTPLIVLMPMLLILGMSRWTADYDKVLIANVESELKIASQYLSRLLGQTGNQLDAVARSVEFSRLLNLPGADQVAFFADTRERLGLDFLEFLPMETAIGAGENWPVIAQATRGISGAEIDVFSNARLATLDDALAVRAKVTLIDTPAAEPTNREIEDRGMVVHAASPVNLSGTQGVLVGGMLLNRNLDFIDTINDLVYVNAVTGGDRQGTATLFLDDLRISTNVRLFEDVRALGTRVSAEVREAVLIDGRTWLDRAFVVNDWYISGYQPITDSFGERVGMLYVGFLEAPFAQAKREAFWWMLTAFFAVLALSAPVFLWLARGIFSPLERMTKVMNRVGKGELSARIGRVPARDEIGAVAHHLDWLLEQVQERDRQLRSWNDELNQRVDQRTVELREANEKLEQTFRQLVMSEKLASIGEITAGVAHEINNPVAVIMGNVDVIRQTLGENAGPVATELGLIDRQVSRIEVIVGKLLKFAAPSEYSDIEHNISLRPLVQDCLVLVDHLINRGGIEVECVFEDVPTVRADSGEVQQVVVNLVVNAVQAMQGAGRLELHLAPAARDGLLGVALSVHDSGPGVPEDLLTSLFDPFFTTKPGEGTGLGLSISQTLIQRAGGIITVRNRAKGGAAFTVWLPQTSEDGVEP